MGHKLQISFLGEAMCVPVLRPDEKSKLWMEQLNCTQGQVSHDTYLGRCPRAFLPSHTHLLLVELHLPNTWIPTCSMKWYSPRIALFSPGPNPIPLSPHWCTCAKKACVSPNKLSIPWSSCTLPSSPTLQLKGAGKCRKLHLVEWDFLQKVYSPMNI